MLAIQKPETKSQKCTPNLLPARLNHNGPVEASQRYWNPQTEDGKTVAYFRGRELHAKALKIPQNYEGAVLHVTDKNLSNSNDGVEEGVEEEEDEEQPDEVKVADQVAEFDEFVVWGHEAVAHDAEDPYARAVSEWIGVAEAIHLDEEGEQKES